MNTVKIIEKLLKEKRIEPREVLKAWVIIENIKEIQGILEYKTEGETK